MHDLKKPEYFAVDTRNQLLEKQFEAFIPWNDDDLMLLDGQKHFIMIRRATPGVCRLVR